MIYEIFIEINGKYEENESFLLHLKFYSATSISEFHSDLLSIN